MLRENKGEMMDNVTIFEEFEDIIEEKYGHMAEDMLSFFDEFTIFFEEENLDVARFTKKEIDTLIGDYLDFEGLADGECSMLFQTLLDFCDFCISKKINYEFFKTFLEKEKDTLYHWWSEEEPLFSEDDFPEINPDEILENFDTYYKFMKLQIKNQKLDIPRILDFLQTTYDIMILGHNKSQEIRKKYPDLTEEEYIKKFEQAIEKEQITKDDFRDIEKTIFLLPKEQVKKFVTISFKMSEYDKYKLRSPERKKVIEENIKRIKDLIDDIKKANKK